MSECILYGSRSFSLKFPGGLTVLYFYPRDNTPGCTNEAKDFTRQLAKFKKLGARVVGVSQDSVESHEKFRAKQGVGFTLVSDPDGELCKKFDVIHEKSLYGKKFQGIVRSTFLLNEHGNILKEWRKVKVPGHVEEVLAFLKDGE